MKRKLLILFLSIATVVCMAFGLSACDLLPSGLEGLSTSTSAENEETTESLDYSLNSDNTYTVTGIGTVTSSKVEIPDTYNGLPVTAVADNAFANNTVIVIIIIGKNVTSVGNNAFYGCTAVNSINFGTNVASIGESAFSGCSSLESVSIPANVKTIGKNAFENCVKLIVVVISGNTQIGADAFTGCIAICDITLSEDIIADLLEILQTAFPDSTLVTTVKTESNTYHAHAVAHYGMTEASCTANGNSEYWYCETCGKYYSDSEATNEIQLADIVIAATEHQFENGECVVCGLESSNVSGRVYLADSDSDLTNNTLLVNVIIILVGTDANGIEHYYQTVSDADGNFSLVEVAYGDYILIAQSEGCIVYTQIISIAFETVQSGNVMLVTEPESEDVSGQVSGYAKNAATGNAISGLTVYVRSGAANTTGEILQTLTTDSDGYYITEDLEPGNYTLQFVDERDNLTDESYRFGSGYINAAVVDDTTVTNQNITLTNSETISAESIRIVLTWGSTPSDLDSHLLVDSDSDGSAEYHIYYSNKTSSGVSANLDVDDTTSYGPETVTITTIDPNATYTYYVHNYTDRNSSNYDNLSNSGATVTIYLGNSSVAYYTAYVPSGSGLYWTVFTYSAESGFTFINTVTTSI
ncbi:MAG: leucine-rich repeat protein [Clostridia bacterium]|nr:leucine-rich repeat protein [Clostridia bacterium]